MPLHNQLTDLPTLQKMQSLQIWSRKVSLKVLYSLASASVSALIPPALSLSHCTLFHNSPCFFPLLWAFSPLLFSILLFLRIQKKKKKKSHSVVSLFYSTNPSSKSASSITPTLRQPSKMSCHVPTCRIEPDHPQASKCIYLYVFFELLFLQEEPHKHSTTCYHSITCSTFISTGGPW